MLSLTAKYADLWNTGYMGKPETMKEPIENLEAACRKNARDPASLGVTAFIGLWFPDLQTQKPIFFDNPLTGTIDEIAVTMRRYAQLGVQHIMFQLEPYVPEARQRLGDALRVYRGMKHS